MSRGTATLVISFDSEYTLGIEVGGECEMKTKYIIRLRDQFCFGFVC